MAKTVADMTPQELIKMLIPAIGELIKAEIRTAEITIKQEIKELKQGQEKLEDRLGQKIDKIAERLNNQEERIERLEEHTGLAKHN